MAKASVKTHQRTNLLRTNFLNGFGRNIFQFLVDDFEGKAVGFSDEFICVKRGEFGYRDCSEE